MSGASKQYRDVEAFGSLEPGWYWVRWTGSSLPQFDEPNGVVLSWDGKSWWYAGIEDDCTDPWFAKNLEVSERLRPPDSFRTIP